jgi:hypothetical protein
VTILERADKLDPNSSLAPAEFVNIGGAQTLGLYPTQKLFTEAILKYFQKIIPEQWHYFRDQVTDNFRIISEQNLRVLE